MEQETLNFVKEFYQQSWDNLLFVITLSFTAIGIFMGIIFPVVLQILQEHRNKKALDTIKKEIIRFNNHHIKELNNKINTLDKDSRFNEGNNHVTQAVIYANNGWHIFALFSYILAFQCFLKAERTTNVNMIFSTISMILSNKFVDISTLQPPESTTLKMHLIDTIQLIEKLDSGGVFSSCKQIFEDVKNNIK